MTTISHEPVEALSEDQPPPVREESREMWPSLAIAAMWLAVLFTSLFGPDFVSSNAGVNFTRIPSGIVVGLFALLGTVAIARRAYGRER